MQKQEFEKRTPFLDEADREHYAELYEPAYMAVSGIDKDKFCKMLKDETVRTFVREVSIAITTADNRERETNNQLVDSRARVSLAEVEIKRLRGALSIVASNCDRALAVE